MKKIFLIIGGFLFLSAFSGCINFFEELIVNEKGGGHFLRKLDMSEMAEMMKSFKEMAKDSSIDMGKEETPKLDDLSNTILDAAEAIKKIEGISNVRTTQDTIKQIFTLEFDFKNDKALNNALNESLSEKKEKAATIYTIDKSSVYRSEQNDLKDAMTANTAEEKEAMQMIEAMMSEVKYNLSITLPGNVKTVSNKDAAIGDTKKVVTFESNLKELMDKTKTIEMKVTYDK